MNTFTSSYSSCVACSGTLSVVSVSNGIINEVCTACGGLHISIADSRHFDALFSGVKMIDDSSDIVYFDVTAPSKRSHGWFDRALNWGGIVQFG